MINVLGRITKDLEFSHECYGEKFYVTQIEVMRSSGVSDTLSLLISEKITSCLFKDEYVDVEGEIRTRNNNGHLMVNIFVTQMNLVEIDLDNERIDYNEVELEGYICKKSEIRNTPNGRVISDFILVKNRVYGSSDYIPCIAWGRNAKYVDTLDIGTKIKINGRMQSRTYIKDNIEHETYEVSIREINEEQD